MSIDFNVFGSDFVTRRQGEVARGLLLQALEAYPKKTRVTVSLAGVVMTPSFADECFGKLLLNLGEEQFRTRVRFVDVDGTTKTLLNAVLSKRSKEFTPSS